MKVLVTGGTGFIGSHTVAALRDSGHEVRLLARTPEKVNRVLGPLAVSPSEVDVVAGDATVEADVRAALDGCDGVVNCVSMVSLGRGDDARVRDVNVRSARLVLGIAVEQGCDPVVHVSSVSALIPPTPPGAVLDHESPVGSPPGAYMQSKADADRYARSLDGPVVLTYPTMVVGPNDPTLGEGMGTVARVLRGQVPVLPPGGMEVIDVRDVAAVHAAAMTPGQGPRRFIVNGTHRSARGLVDDLRRLTGRRIPCGPIPTAVAKVASRAGDLAERVLPVHNPLTAEGLWVLTLDARTDDAETRRALGVKPRPLDDTLVDTVRWMTEAGIITRRQAGHLA